MEKLLYNGYEYNKENWNNALYFIEEYCGYNPEPNGGYVCYTDTELKEAKELMRNKAYIHPVTNKQNVRVYEINKDLTYNQIEDWRE